MEDVLGINEAFTAVSDDSGAKLLITFVVGDLMVSIEVATVSQKNQLLSYFRTYTPYEMETLLNLKTWGAARNMKVEFRVLRKYRVASWVLMFIVAAYEKSAEVRELHPPVKWPKGKIGTH